MPLSVWQELVGAPEGPEPATVAPVLPWYERMTPLANACEIALELLHCTPREYYARTTESERMLITMHLAYRQKQHAMRDRLAEARSRPPERY